jgi:hypothetical protein
MKRMQYYLAMFMLWFVLSALLAFPTLHLEKNLIGFGPATVGGGPIRQWVCNTLLLPMLPSGLAQQAAAFFKAASVLQEWVLTAITLLPYSAAFVPLLLLVAPAIGQIRKRYRQTLYY